MRHPPLLAAFIALTLSLAVAMAAAAPQTVLRRNFSAAQKSDLKRISEYLNGVQTLKGKFVQLDPDGTLVHGTFYLKKPGRVRFEYQPPNPNLIVADGRTLAVANSRLKTVDRFPLIGSPLALLLSDDIDLSVSTHVTAVQRQPGYVLVSANAASGATQSQITVTFTDPGLELRQWEIFDSQGLKTTVVLNDVVSGVELPADLFVIREAGALRKSQN